MSADFGAVLLWLIPAAAAALIAWTRGQRLARLRAQHARADDEAAARHEAAVADVALEVGVWQRRWAVARRDADEWERIACDNYRLFIDAKYTSPTPAAVPSDLDRAREKRDVRGRFVAKAVAE